MGAKNARPNKENEDKKPESAPPRGHQYDEIDEEIFIQNRENLGEEKKKQNGGNVNHPSDSTGSKDNISTCNTPTKARIHPYDDVVVDAEGTEEQSSEKDQVREKDGVKIHSKGKDKKDKKEEKKKEKKNGEKSKEVKEAALGSVAVDNATDADDVEYTNVTALKKAEVTENAQTTKDDCVYAQPIKTKKKDKGINSQKSESKKSKESQPVKQLNYIEVEIAPKPAKAPKPETKSPHTHTAYSNIIKENGRIVLVPEQ